MNHKKELLWGLRVRYIPKLYKGLWIRRVRLLLPLGCCGGKDGGKADGKLQI